MATGQNNPFFTPRQISGCQLWLDATDPNANGVSPSSGAGLITWKDKSSNAFSGTAVNSPTFTLNLQNRLPAIQFNGTNQYINFGNVLNLGTSQIFVFAVAQFSGDASVVAKSSFRGNTGRWFLIRAAGDGGQEFGIDIGSGGVTAVFSDSTTTAQLMMGAWDRSTNYTFQNGTQKATASVSSSSSLSNTDPLYVGAYGNSTGTGPQSGFYLNGFICEILVYQASITTSQREQIEGYLAWKWGLQANLPSTHPYKSTPIPPLLSPPTTAPVSIQNPSFSDWSPLQISGCQLWLDATDSTSVTLNSTSVTQWSDKSGNARHVTQSTLANAPNYTRVGSNLMIDFVRANKTYLINASYSQIYTNFTLYMIIKRKAVPLDNERMFVAIPVGYATDWNTQTGFSFSSTIELAANGSGSSYSESSNLNTTMYSIVTSSNSANVYKNGDSSSVISRSLGLTGNSIGILLGSGTNSGINTLSEQFNGYIGEVILFTKVLTTSERQQIDAYLALKWGLQRFLPASHPNKNQVPIKSGPNVNSLSVGLRAQWLPLQISGLQLWLDGVDVNGNGTSPANGAGVSTWTDKSGNAYNLSQATSARQPTKVSTGVLFTSANSNFMTMSIPFFQNHTVFIVSTMQASGGAYLISRSAAIGGGPAVLSYSTRLRYIDITDDADFLNGSTLPGRVLVSYTRQQGVRIIGFLNGGQAFSISQSASTNLTAAFDFFCCTDGTANFYDGTMSEYIYYNGVLSQSQRQNVEGYLAWKWGLQSSLPSTHPFAKWPPSP
jgi:hypothetical protein